MKRLGFLDSLRGIAAVYVLVFHTALIPHPALALPEWANPVIMFGGSGVILFFVISAFSLCLTMDRHQSTRMPTTSYFIARFFRIAPLFYFLLIVTLCRDNWLLGMQHSVFETAASALFIFNFVPGFQTGIVWASWTIGVEMPFYLIFPLLYASLPGIIGRLTALGIALICWMLLGYLLWLSQPTPQVSDGFRTYSVFGFISTFLIGMLAFELHQRLVRLELPQQLGRLLIVAGLLGLSFLICDYSPASIKYSTTMQAVGYAFILLGCSLQAPALLNNRVSQFFGKISYSLYLWHPPIILALSPVFQRIQALSGMPTTVKFALSCVLSLTAVTAASYITYRLVERPFVRLGGALRARLLRSPFKPTAG